MKMRTGWAAAVVAAISAEAAGAAGSSAQAQAAKNDAAAKGELRVYFVDVEGGQSTLFVMPSGESLLVDTGSPDPRTRRAAGRGTDRGGGKIGGRDEDRQPGDHALPLDHVGGLPEAGEDDSGGAVHRPRCEPPDAGSRCRGPKMRDTTRTRRCWRIPRRKHLTVKPEMCCR